MTREIPLTQGKVAIVDDCDYEWLSAFQWWADKGGKTFYAKSRVGGVRFIKMHRLIISAPEGIDVDHVDLNGLNNTRENLRLATRSQNTANTTRQSNNTSGFNGVSWHTHTHKWAAYIRVNGKKHHLGLFADCAEAARAYDTAAREAFGEFARLNFPL